TSPWLAPWCVPLLAFDPAARRISEDLTSPILHELASFQQRTWALTTRRLFLRARTSGQPEDGQNPQDMGRRHRSSAGGCSLALAGHVISGLERPPASMLARTAGPRRSPAAVAPSLATKWSDP